MTHVRNFLKRSSFLAGAFLIVATWIVGDVAIFTQIAHAAQLTSRSLTVSSSANGSVAQGAAGSGTNGAQAKHTVTFTMGTSGATIGAIAIIYCDSPIPQTSCTSSAAATGNAQNLTSATVGGSGLGGTGWALDTATSNPTVAGYGTCNGSGTTRENCVLVKPSSTGANTGTPTITVTYGGTGGSYYINPTNNTTFYARIVVFSNNYTTVVDNGGVASATAQEITVTAKVQETLNFSVGSPVSAGSGSVPAAGASCAAFNDAGNLQLGDTTNGTLNFTQAYDAHSYFRVSTNANNGTVIYYSGDTLKNAAGNSISATGTTQPTPNTAVASDVGTSQFGLAIDSADPEANGFSFTSLTASAPYAAGNGTITDGGTALFAFAPSSLTTPIPIASASTPIVCDTGSVRYLGNISTTTPPGIYTTKISYIAAPTY